MPSAAPGSVTARMHSAIITTNSVAIMTFVTRSTPFCRPKLHTKKPITTATTIHPTSHAGFSSIPLNAAPAKAASAPSNMPDAICGTYEIIHPHTVV